MQVTTIEGIIKNGQIVLTEGIKLPEMATVYVIIPNQSAKKIMRPKLVNREKAKLFQKTIEVDVDDEV